MMVEKIIFDLIYMVTRKDESNTNLREHLDFTLKEQLLVNQSDLVTASNKMTSQSNES